MNEHIQKSAQVNQELQKAIELREKGELNESKNIILRLVEDHPNNAFLNYQCAWSHDVLGEERKAVPYYEKAIQLGLEKENLEDALLGLGSTYRTLGEYEKSKETFLKGLESFPNNRAIQVFYAMTLYNVKEHHQAMELLLKNIAETTGDEDIKKFGRAIGFYADKLDTVWE
ncbi:tetratricopeptide repeat protein [Oceanobacillus jeddahense]|uniref:tetratricopeptide repeat protein n=1 Tax=Oceanobacillus jeddahense TaxID=1462527 RepID=UPI0006940E50|nr:tetratricopeptide repeat protein [Oceanobacillus jeddahense]